MRRVIPYIVFAAIYAVLLSLAGLGTRQLGSGALVAAADWIAPFLAAPPALLVAMRCGRLSNGGVAFSSAGLAAVIVVATPRRPPDFE